MPEIRSRSDLRNQLFYNSAQPDEDDFASLSLSHIHKTEDGLSIDANGSFQFARGIRVGDIPEDTEASAGYLRYNPATNTLQVHNGAEFQDVGTGDSGSEGFVTVEANNLAYNGLRVGIGTGAAAPVYRLDVTTNAEPGASINRGQQIRFGTAVISRGAGTQGQFACFGHESHANNNGFALKHTGGGRLELNTSGASGDNRQIRFNIGGTTRAMTLDENGNLGIGENVPTARLHVSGDAIFTGTVTATAFNTEPTSDVRYKESIEKISEGLNVINALNGVRFNWKREEFPQMGFGSGRQIGLIAQEVEAFLPELVGTNADGYKTLNYSSLIPVLIEAVKELSTNQENLLAQMYELQTKLSALHPDVDTNHTVPPVKAKQNAI